MEVEYFTLGDFVVESKGGTSIKTTEYTASGIPVLTKGDVKPFGRVEHGGKYVDKEYALKKGWKFTEPGDLIVTTRDLTIAANFLGLISLVPAHYSFVVNQGATIFKVDVSRIDPKYLIYWSANHEYRNYIKNNHVGSTQIHIRQGELFGAPVAVPELSEQKRIVSVLEAFDKKIDLNRQINTTLESMAQALFKSWFVDFDPVIDNALAAGNKIPEPLQARAEKRAGLHQNAACLALPDDVKRQFPDSFVFTEDMGWMPEGWGVGTLLDIADLLSGGTPKTGVADYWDGNISWASAKDVSQCGEAFLIQTEKKITDLGLAKSSTKLIDKYSTVVVSRGATTGRLAMFAETFAMNQTCYALRSKNETPFYLYCKVSDVISNVVHSAHGSIFDTITTKTFQSTQVLLGDPEMAQVFEEQVQPIFVRLKSSLEESQTLANLRDSLLPKLLSGQLSIPEAEQALDQAM